MRNLVWGKTLLESYKYLKRLINSLDRIIYEKSVNSYGRDFDGRNTLDSMEAVIDLIQRKKKMLLIKMLVEEGLKNIEKKDAKILIKYYIDKIDLKAIAQSENQERRNMARIIDKIILDLMDKISVMGYNSNKIENLLKSEGWIVGIFNSHIKQGSKNKIDPLVYPAQNKLDRILTAYCYQKSNMHSIA